MSGPPDPETIAADPTGWFDPLYAEAGRDASRVPWARLSPHPFVVDWLDRLEGGVGDLTACVVGCGLGDDAAELARRGATVTAFDVSETAVGWARERFDGAALRGRLTFAVADLTALPRAWRRQFDLVVEVRTIQSLPPAIRSPASGAVGALVGPQGLLCVVAHLATSDEAAARAGGPPWPLTPAELADFRADGLDRLALEHPEQVEGDVMEVVATYTRPAA